MSWRVCNTNNTNPGYYNIQVPTYAGQYHYTISGCAPVVACTEPKRRAYKELNNSNDRIYKPCTELFAAYKAAVKEEDDANFAKYHMTKDQYIGYLRDHGLSTENLSNVEKPNVSHCSMSHDDNGNHIVYSMHYSNYGCHNHYGHRGGYHGCFH
ncbi:hypothetical protein GGF37_003058 [Kickxella alabastrina]|nr:hypothetical protein GGF37_003058 [Kickxella alabastrina]